MWILGQSFSGEMIEKGSSVHAGLWLTPSSARVTRGLFLLVPKTVEKASREDQLEKQEQSPCVLADFLSMGLFCSHLVLEIQSPGPVDPHSTALIPQTQPGPLCLDCVNSGLFMGKLSAPRHFISPAVKSIYSTLCCLSYIS